MSRNASELKSEKNIVRPPQKDYPRGCLSLPMLEDIDRRLDLEKIKIMVDKLPGLERACLSLYYGIGSAKAFSLYLISRKIGAPEWMIKRYIARGILLLKRQIGETSLPARIHRHA